MCVKQREGAGGSSDDGREGDEHAAEPRGAGVDALPPSVHPLVVLLGVRLDEDGRDEERGVVRERERQAPVPHQLRVPPEAHRDGVVPRQRRPERLYTGVGSRVEDKAGARRRKGLLSRRRLGIWSCALLGFARRWKSELPGAEETEG